MFRLSIVLFVLAAPVDALAQGLGGAREGGVKAGASGNTSTDLEGRRAGESRVFGSIPGLAMQWCPAGGFVMGSEKGEVGERPRRVRLTRGFWMGRTEVTQAQWRAVMGRNPSHFQGADLPVENMTWNDCVDFCNRLTRLDRTAGRLPAGCSYRLPTEAQWEFACRAGGETQKTGRIGVTCTVETGVLPQVTDVVSPGPASQAGVMVGDKLLSARDWPDGVQKSLKGDLAWTLKVSGPLGSKVELTLQRKDSSVASIVVGRDLQMPVADVNERAWHCTNSGDTTHPVAQTRANAWGIHDMLGNVWEYCADWFADGHPAGEAVDPTGPATGSYRVARGGSWFGSAEHPYSRYAFDPASHGGSLGFRVVLSRTDPEPGAPMTSTGNSAP